MTKFSAKKINNGRWEIWEHIEDCKRQVCVMTSNDILDLFNKIVPMEVKEPYMIGNPECEHAWRPWKFNDDFMRCANCPAMQKIKRLVPRIYE